MRHLSAFLLPLLLVGCIQEAKWTWTGDSTDAVDAMDGVSADGKGEVGSPDLAAEVDACTPNCAGRECGTDGCGGTCGDCDDGDTCDGEELCDKGHCLSGTSLNCDDGNDCTEDSCDPAEGCVNDALDGEFCEDENPCTLSDKCVDDTCQGGAWDACDDENHCTDDSCEGGVGCQHEPVPDGDESACDDGNPCTEEVCESGNCENPLLPLDELIIEDCLCEEDADCTPLEDENFCNGTLVCGLEVEPPTCLLDEETVVTCTLPEGAAPECNVPVCIPETGNCSVGHINNDGPCSDGDACTQGDLCDEGLCKAGGPMECGDGNPCTDDSCDPLSGCVNAPNTDGCDDGEGCTHSDTCLDGVCSGIQYSCDDPGQCETVDGVTCNGDGTCTYPTAPMNGTLCDDGDACTEGEQCADGACVGGAAVDCDDGNPCTDDGCEPLSGCAYTNNAGVCTDDDPCTTGDHCDGGGCATTEILGCDDANPCTDDECIAGVGCDYTPNADLCDDGDPETTGDHCVAGVCVGNIAPVDDHDHDGVCPDAGCAVQAPDPCPTVWTPDGSSDLCTPLPGTFSASRSVPLAEPGAPTGASTWRRTYEPVEIPLKNGILDDSVVGYWTFDGDCSDSSSMNTPCSEVNEPELSDGPFGDGNEAFYFDNESSGDGKPYLKTDLGFDWGVDASFAVLLWAKAEGTEGNLGGGGGVFGTNKPGSELHFHVAHPTIDFGLDIRDEDGDSIDVEYNLDSLPDSDWHHYAAVFNAQDHSLSIFMDSGLVGREVSDVFSGMDLSAQPPYIGAYNNGDGAVFGHFHGTIDDVIVFQRALSPVEIASYYNSHAPYATDFVAGAQEDLDDVRVTEVSKPGGEAHQVPFEVLGPRPHSDTPCPYDDTDPTSVPHIADREDLCGVVAYWPLDGDGEDHGGAGLDLSPVDVTTAATGRFGDSVGSVGFSGAASAMRIGSAVFGQQTDDLTVEFWLWVDALPTNNLGQVGLFGEFIEGTDYHTRNYIALRNEGTISMDHFPPTSETTVSDHALQPMQWIYVAVVVENKTRTIYLNGLPDVVEEDTESYSGDAPTWTYIASRPWSPVGAVGLGGRMDEVVLHRVAKSPEYIYRRANPGVPTVRFLASTEVEDAGGDGFDWYDYALHWGDGDAAGQQAELKGLDGDECYGLLSPCLGYAGWWRFNEGGGTLAVDSSTHKDNGAVEGEPDWTGGMEGTAIAFDGFNDRVYIANVPEIPDGTSFALEAVATPDEFCQEEGDASRIANRNSSEGGYLLRVDCLTGSARASVQSPPLTWQSAIGEPLGIGVPSALAMTFTGETLTVYTNAASPASTSVVMPDTTTPQLFSIGTNSGATSHLFNGTIDSVRLTSRALQPDEFLHYPLVDWVQGEGNLPF